ncbi:MAG: tripartite tricarboxylate transporter TctB family protein [Spirochaetales bacterium]|nr:tripartite tricarboxylate transporter TctB family protein [Spirochaetales bacterium]
MSHEKKNIISGFFFLALSVFIYAVSYTIKLVKADSLGPQFFPRLVSFIMAQLAVYLIAVNALRLRRNREKTEKKIFKLNIPLIVTSVLLVAYGLLINSLGFIVTTMLYLFVQIYMLLPLECLKKRSYMIITACVSLLTPVFIYYLFYMAFNIFLPVGILG